MKRISLLFLVVIACNCATTKKPEEKKIPWQMYFASEPASFSEDTVIQEAQRRSVTVLTVDGACTGGIGSTGIIVTASHCLTKDTNEVFVNGFKARVLKNVKGRDVLFLHIQTEAFKGLDFAEPKVDMDVFAVVNQQRFRGVVKHGKITHCREEMFSTDIVLMPGSSGGLVYTKDGKLVGMITQWESLMSSAVSGLRIGKEAFEAGNKGELQ